MMWSLSSSSKTFESAVELGTHCCNFKRDYGLISHMLLQAYSDFGGDVAQTIVEGWYGGEWTAQRVVAAWQGTGRFRAGSGGRCDMVWRFDVEYLLSAPDQQEIKAIIRKLDHFDSTGVVQLTDSTRIRVLCHFAAAKLHYSLQHYLHGRGVLTTTKGAE